MKSKILLIIALLSITICITCVILINRQAEYKQIKADNKEYEIYFEKEVYGTDLATLIGKTINQNEKNMVKKDEKGYYINNGKNSIEIDLKMHTIEKTYPMEEIYNNKIINFVKNFNIIKFKCTKIEYHEKTKRISNLTFEELE